MSTTNKSCQWCSEYLQAGQIPAIGRRVSHLVLANQNGWVITKDSKGFTLFFCCKECEFKYNVKNKTHLKSVK